MQENARQDLRIVERLNHGEKNQIWYRSHDIEKIVVDDADDIETSDMKIDGQGCRFEIGT